MSVYSELLNRSGLKATSQRLGILEVLEKRGHSSIDEIYHIVLESQPSISLATVYKNVDIMLKKGVLVEVPIAGAKSQFEIKKHDHIHLICQECGRVTDETIRVVPQEELERLALKDDFIFDRAQINLYGICRQCRKAI